MNRHDHHAAALELDSDAAKVTFRNIGNVKPANTVFRFAPWLALKRMAAYG